MSGRACAVCAGRLAERFARVVDPETGEGFSLLQCVDCGLGHTDPVPPDLGRYYGVEYHGGRHGVTARLCANRRLRILQRGGRGVGTIVDVGCGDGTFLLAAREHGWRVAGTERIDAAARARAAGIEVGAELASLAHLAPLAAVTAWHSLEHVEDPLGLLKTARAMLASDGVLIVAVPDARGVQARLFRDRWFHLDVPRHLLHFDRRSLSNLLRVAGFEVLRWKHSELEYDLFGWVQSALDRVIPLPRVLFHGLTGRPVRGRRLAFGASLALGVAAGTVALPLTVLGELTRSGGTLVAVAKRR